MSYRRFYYGGGVSPFLQMLVFILAIGLLVVLGYRQLDRVIAPRRTVVVIQKSLEPGETIGSEHLAVADVRTSTLTAAAIEDPGLAIGQVVSRPKKEGEAIYPSDFQQPAVGPRTALATLVPEGRVVTTITLTNPTIPYRELHQGDRIDILAAGRTVNKGKGSGVIVRDAYVVGYLAPPVPRSTPRKGLLGIMGAGSERKAAPPPGLMVAVFPQDVLPLAEIDGSGAHLTLALHNTQTVKDGTMLTVQRIPYPRQVDVISGDERESVEVIQ